MARNNPKPGGKVDWDATGNIVEPNAGRKTSGWLFSVKPPAQNFNWLWNLLGLQQFYSNAQVQDWIVIDSDADERDYATLTAYLADSPAAGDRLLIKEDQTVTVQTVIPSDITIKFLDGSRLLCATNIATSVLQMGSDIIIEGILTIVLSQTGTTDKAVEYNGDNVFGQIDVENASTGTLTTAHNINSGKTGNQIEGIAENSGGGTLTTVLADNSTEDSNNMIIVDEPNNKLTRSRGAYKFRDGFEFDLSSDANGDIYYRDAGVLKRLAKGANDTYLRLVAGIPSWSNTFVGIINTTNAIIASGGVKTDGTNTIKTTVIDIGDWNMDSIITVNIAHGLTLAKIRTIDVTIRKDDTSLLTMDFTITGLTIIEVDAANVNITRNIGGIFDNTDYNATSFNRGWITITYIA